MSNPENSGFWVLGLFGQESGLTVFGSKRHCVSVSNTVSFRPRHSVFFFGRAGEGAGVSHKRAQRAQSNGRRCVFLSPRRGGSQGRAECREAQASPPPRCWGSSQSVCYPIRGASAIENRPNTCRAVFDSIVHSVGESFCKQPEIAILHIMHPAVNAQRRAPRTRVSAFRGRSGSPNSSPLFSLPIVANNDVRQKNYIAFASGQPHIIFFPSGPAEKPD